MAAPPRPVGNDVITSLWGQWAHDRLAAVTTSTVGLTGNATTDPTGIMLGGTITVPASTVDRVLLCSFTILASTALATGFDFYLTVGGVNRKRVRIAPNLMASVTLEYQMALPATGSGTAVGVRAASTSGSAAFQLNGSSDLNYLCVTTVPVP